MQARSTAAAGFAVLAVLATASSAAAHTPDPVSTEVTGTTLTVTGTDRGDAIRLTVRGDELRVRIPGRDPRFPLTAVDQVTIAPGGGDDTVELEGTDGEEHVDLLTFGGTVFVLGMPLFTQLEGAEPGDTLVLDAEGGDDVVSASSLAAGVLGLVLEGDDGDDELTGSRGADLILGGDGNEFAIGGPGDDAAALGGGNDIFRWDPGEGSDAVEFGSGFDALSFLGAAVPERVDVRAVGRDVRLTRDIGAIVMDLGGMERFSVFLQGGADAGTIGDLSGDGTRRPDRFAVTGGVQNPQGTSTSAEVRGIPASVLVTGVQKDDALTLNGRGGEDTLDDSGLIPGGFALTFAQ